MNVLEAYQLEDHPSIKVGKSKFASFRPQHVRISLVNMYYVVAS